jgi:hypothetical protein
MFVSVECKRTTSDDVIRLAFMLHIGRAQEGKTEKTEIRRDVSNEFQSY